MSKPQERLPEWLVEIETRLRNGSATFGAKTVLELLELCLAQRKVLKHSMKSMKRWTDVDRTTLVDEYKEAERRWEGK